MIKKVEWTSEKKRWKWQKVKKKGVRGKSERRERWVNGGMRKRERESARGLIFNVINEL